jgi:hypothetical protein
MSRLVLAFVAAVVLAGCGGGRSASEQDAYDAGYSLGSASADDIRSGVSSMAELAAACSSTYEAWLSSSGAEGDPDVAKAMAEGCRDGATE